MTNPLSNTECQQLVNELKILDNAPDAKSSVRRYEIIHDLAEAHCYEATPYLVAGLKNPDPDYRIECISALVTHWKNSDPQVVVPLLEMAVNDPDRSVRYGAIDSLKILKVRGALPVLQQIAENKSAGLQLRNTAYNAFLEIAESFPEITELPNFDLHVECTHLFEELKQFETTSTEKWTEEKYNIINDLAVAGFHEAKPYFVAGLDNSDPTYRKACIIALGQTWRDRSVEIVSKLLEKAKNDPDDSVKNIALFTLGSLKVKDALPLLKKMVKDNTQPISARKTAYSHILSIYDYSPEKILGITEKFNLDSINKDLLDKIPDLPV